MVPEELSGYIAYARIREHTQSATIRSGNLTRERKDAYHNQGIHHNRINMRYLLLVRHLRNLMHHIRPQPKLFYPLYCSRLIPDRIHEKNSALLEGLHLGQRTLHRTLTDLRSDGEEELGSFLDFGLDPHVTLHKGYEAFRDR